MPVAAEPLLPAGRRRAAADAAAAAALAHVTSRRAVAVVCAGPKEVSLCTYNLELGQGQAPALAHALEAALARATLRRTALLRLLLPPLLPPLRLPAAAAAEPLPLAMHNNDQSHAAVPVFAEEEAAERDAGMAALSRLLPPLKPALLAAVPLPQVLLEPSEDGRPGLAVTAAGALELFSR